MRRSGAPRRIELFLILALAVAVASCGGVHYGFAGGGLPSRIRTMSVIPFENQTASAEIQRELFDLMRRELQRRLGVRDASEDRADAVVRGVIDAYDIDVPVGISADRNQTVSASRYLEVTVDVEIVEQSSGHVLFQRKGMKGQGEYRDRGEADGRKVALQRIVNSIVEGAQSQW